MRKAAIIVLALASAFHVPTLNAQTTLEYPINSPFELGQGWDTNLQRPVTATCIDFKKGKLASSDVPQSRLYVATDKSTTSLALSTSSSAELTLPIGSGSASLDFSGKVSSAADSLLVIAEARVELGPEYVSPKDFTTPTIPTPQDSTSRTLSPALTGANEIRLRDPYRKLLRISYERFRKACGDSFVYAIHGGAVIYGVVEIKNVTQQERATLSAAAKASSLNVGGTASAAFSGKFSTEYARYTEQGRTQSMFIAYGSGDTIPTDQTGLVTTLQNLPRTAKQFPRNLRFSTLPYSSLAEWSNGPIGRPAESTVSRLTRQWIELDSLRATISSILASRDYLFAFDLSQRRLYELDRQILIARGDVERRLSLCSKGQECSAKGIEKMDIYELRASLPIKGTFADFAEGNDLHRLVERLADERWRTWIAEEHRLRCELLPSECKSQIELIDLRKRISSAMYRSIGM